MTPGHRPIRRQVGITLALISAIVLTVSGLLFNQVLENQAEYLVDMRSRALMDLILSVRDYTSESVSPLVDPMNTSSDVFHPAAVPSFAAERVFDLYERRRDTEGLTYQEAALNPTDPQDQADAFETTLINRFRDNPELKELSGEQSINGHLVHYLSRPIRVDSQSCLRCHSNPNLAPRSQIERYGSTGGFGWSLNETVGAQVLTVPQKDIFELHDQSLAVTGILFISSFSLLILVANTVLDQQVLKPLLSTATALRRLRAGEFDLNLTTQRTDEMGGLLNDINYTSQRLKGLVESEKTMAMKSQQIETARAIHRCFLVKRLPQSQDLRIAAESIPALEVGADWYDAFVVGKITFIVVADVCDKGIGSALFMSVFRSLIHFSLESYDEDSDADISTCLTAVLGRINDYIATNHEDQVMFATIFIAAHNNATHQLTYINAGHELPILITSKGLERLGVTGPAVGVFPASTFKTGEVSLEPGAFLFAYSDGLTDARSPSGEAWGIEGLQASLLRHYSPDVSANDLINSVEDDVAQHVAGSDPFDDLTLLTVKVDRSR